MLSWQALPDVRLAPQGPMASAFIEHGAHNLQHAGALLQSLPYGRNANPQRPRCVLDESRGTCSTKHALLARLAQEQDLPIHLTLGIYTMHEQNTPGVGAVLDANALPYIPEAHCFLTFESSRIDVTRTPGAPSTPIVELLHEEQITPDQIGAYKLTMHQRILREWIASNPDDSCGYTFNRIWSIREACIAALAE